MRALYLLPILLICLFLVAACLSSNSSKVLDSAEGTIDHIEYLQGSLLGSQEKTIIYFTDGRTFICPHYISVSEAAGSAVRIERIYNDLLVRCYFTKL